ncbi:MAG: hypothetical protein BGP16_14120 [Sphingobium sp. 66-54]|nr:MAG: hypothetical protein BGP16_14120 [Sphingobium sp. 66-54]
MASETYGKMIRHLQRPGALIILFLLANFAFLLRFADRDGYEGDDLNSILPMAHLDAAKQGSLLIYRYAWQPLSYEAGAIIWRLFGTPNAVFLMAPAAGALALGLMLWWLYREGRSPTPFLMALIALVGIPELWYSALYYNSTVLGMPLLASALLLARGGGGIVHAAVAGLLTGFAILMRIDFILICPLLAMAAWPRGAGLTRPIAVAAGVVAVLIGAAAMGLLDFEEIVRIQALGAAEISAKSTMAGWDLRTKIFVLTVTLSPVGWLLLLIGLPCLLTTAARKRSWRALGWCATALPALYPLFSMLSPKYILPLAPFLLLLFVRTQEVVTEWLAGRWQPWLRGGLIAAATTPIILSVSPMGHAPFLMLGLTPLRPIGTHDGPRGYGGYLWQMIATDAQIERTAEQRAAAQLEQNLLTGTPRRMQILGGENYFDRGGIGWRHLQLALEKRDIHGTLIAPHTLLFDLGPGRRIVLAHAPLAMTEGYETIDLRENAGEIR